jgi:hypothetical protein
MNTADESIRSRLGELPDELLLAIISQLKVRRGFLADREIEAARRVENTIVIRGLHTLTLTCQRLNAIATPFLYTCIILSSQRVWALKPLLRTLLGKPDTVPHIRYFENSIPSWMEWDDVDQNRGSDQRDYAQALAGAKWTIPNIEVPTRGRTPDGITGQARNTVIFQNYLWNVVSRLGGESMIELGVSTIIALAGNLSEVATSFTPASTALLSYKSYPPNGGPLTIWLSSFLYQDKSLCTFKATTGEELAHIFLNSELGLSGIHGAELDEISLQIVDHGIASFWEYLDGCESLKSFTCRWRAAEPNRPDYPDPLTIDFPFLGEKLMKFSTSLERLQIDTVDSHWLVDSEDDIEAIGILRGFTSLKHLDITGTVLWGEWNTIDYPNLELSSILPSSLETLNIKAERTDPVEFALLLLLNDMSAALPNLRSIECSWRSAPKSAVECLVIAYRKLDVDLVLVVAGS